MTDKVVTSGNFMLSTELDDLLERVQSEMGMTRDEQEAVLLAARAAYVANGVLRGELQEARNDAVMLRHRLNIEKASRKESEHIQNLSLGEQLRRIAVDVDELEDAV